MSIKDYLFRKASLMRIPLAGTFELSPVCNFSCRMCYVRKTAKQLEKEGHRLYSIEQWIKLANECKEAGMLYLLLTGGEPFLYPEFKILYEKLHSMGLLLSINTNASLIDDSIIEWLKDYAPANINVTLYGASEETYEKICGNGAAYKKVQENIRKLKDVGIFVSINASMIPENADDMEKIIHFGKKYDIPVRVGTYMFPPVRRESEESDSRFTPEEAGEMGVLKYYYELDEDGFREVGKKMLSTLKQEDEMENVWGYGPETMKCRAGRSTFWVSWEGKMSACGIMDFPIVQYPFENDFEKCWLNLTEAVRTKTVLKECAGCPKKEICHPCAAIISTETGDVNKKAPYLCEMSDASLNCWKRMLENGGVKSAKEEYISKEKNSPKKKTEEYNSLEENCD